jgi:hydantoinase/carbamoylase family amidase
MTSQEGAPMLAAPIQIDRARSAERIARDVAALAGPEYTLSSEAIRRYAYTPAYRNTLDYFTRQLESCGFDVYEDPVGNFVARNRPKGEKVFGIGSHCDSNRNGGKYDGTLGVVTALEVCRLSDDLRLDLPLQLISFLEEESSGFAQPLLGSRIMAQRVTDEELRTTFRAIDDGRTFWEHAEEAGYEPARWRESIHVLDDLVGWIELHIEQARVLQDTGDRIGIVTAIVGLLWADIEVYGRADHAGATPMDFRQDAGAVAAECVLELERLARVAGHGTVGTAGESEIRPGIINVIPGQAHLGLDIRSVEEQAYQGVARDIADFAVKAAARRGMRAEYTQRQNTPPTRMDEGVVAALEAAAQASGQPYRLMPSGAGHDTQLVAQYVPSAMVFVPCKDGISHAPDEQADPADAALGAEIILNAIRAIRGVPSSG